MEGVGALFPGIWHYKYIKCFIKEEYIKDIINKVYSLNFCTKQIATYKIIFNIVLH